MPNSQTHVPKRSIRVPDNLWAAAQEACERRGDGTLSDVVRRLLQEYVASPDRQLPELFEVYRRALQAPRPVAPRSTRPRSGAA